MNAPDLFHWRQRPELPLARAGCAAGVLAGKLVVAGGTFWREGKKFWCAEVHSFDPASNHWEKNRSLPQAHGDGAAAVFDDTLYVFGGGTDEITVESVQSLHDGVWRLRPEMKLPSPRRTSAVVVLGRTFYLLGGLADTWTNFSAATSTMWAYPVGGAAWESLPPMPGPTRFNAAVGAVDGRILVAGGCTSRTGKVENLDDILSFDPAHRTWSDLGKLPRASRGACGLVDDRRLLIFGGYTDKFEAEVVSVDPLRGTAEQVGLLPCGLADTRFLRLGRSIFGVSGENGVKMRFPGLLEAVDATP